MRISDWISDVCSSDLGSFVLPDFTLRVGGEKYFWEHWGMMSDEGYSAHRKKKKAWYEINFPGRLIETLESSQLSSDANSLIRSEEHTSELQSLMRISYAVFCLKKKRQTDTK